MTIRDRDKTLEIELERMLAPTFPGIVIEVRHSERWGRMSVSFRWEGFVDLLPEERFHRLAAAIPQEFRDSRLAGFVWLELGPAESVEDYLELPRSEDVAQREGGIYAELVRVDFFGALGKALGPSPRQHCQGGFSATDAVLDAKKSVSLIRDAKLIFIRYGAYCDCQVLQTVQFELAMLHTDAA